VTTPLGTIAMYESFYGFRENPFGMTPNPHFLFPSKKHEEALAHLVYGITQRKGFVAVTGEVGAGKTTLCRVLLDRLPEDHASALILNPSLSATELLRDILKDFGLPARGKTKRGLLEELNRFLLERFSQGKNAVVVIDECQDLASGVLEQIRLISNLETETTKLIQIVLVGQPELKEKLSQPELRQLEQRITVRYHLEPLDQRETAEYIEHRLRIAGPNHEARFKQSALDGIYDYSKGVPRLINVLCDRTLLAGFVDGTLTLDKFHVDKAASDVRWDTQGNGERFAQGTPFPWKKTAVLVSALLVGGIGGAWIVRHQSSSPAKSGDTRAHDETLSLPAVSSAPLATPTPAPPPGALRSASACSILMDLWGVDSDRAALVEVFSEAPLEIPSLKGLLSAELRTSLEGLKSLDVPVLAELYESSMESSNWLVFLGEREGRILMHDGTETVETSREEFERRWLGRILLLWRDFDDLASHPERAASLMMEPMEGADTLEESVRLYQEERGLEATGRMDPATAVRLYADAYPSRVPRLLWREVAP